MEILRKKEREDSGPKKKRHSVLLELDDADDERLQAMVAYTESSQADVLRQCLRHVHSAQFGRVG